MSIGRELVAVFARAAAAAALAVFALPTAGAQEKAQTPGAPQGIKVEPQKVKLWGMAAKLAKETGRTASDVISVTVPGRYRAVVCDGWGEREHFPGGLGCFYDLANDPECKYDYACPWGGGLLMPGFHVKPRREWEAPGHMPVIMAGPGTVELVEANPVRAVVRYLWDARGYGAPTNPANPDVRVEETFVFYAPDKVCETFVLVGTAEQVEIDYVGLTLHTSHAKWSGGKTESGGGWSIPGPWTFLPDEGTGPKNFILHVARPGVVTHGDGTRSLHKENFLLIQYEPCANNYSGNRGNRWLGYRTSFEYHVKDKVITRDKRLVAYHAAMHANHEITDLEKAAPYVKEYREPGTPKCTRGKPVGDGFDEAMGCYQLEAAEGGVDFELPVTCHWPAFEVSGWTGGAPRTVQVDGKPARLGEDYLAGAEKRRLLLQVRREVKEGARIVIAADGSPEDKGFFSAGK